MEEREVRKEDLKTMDLSLFFLLLIIFAVLLSLWAALLQRRQLRLTLEGRDLSQVPPVIPIRKAGSAITVGCLGFFLCLALGTLRQAQAGNDPSAERSARANTMASLLVLLAAVLRLLDLQAVKREQQTFLLEETTLPD